MFRQNVLEGMLADPAYGGNKDMVGWKWVGFPGDPMRRGDSVRQVRLHRQAVPVRAQAAAARIEGGEGRHDAARPPTATGERATIPAVEGG